MRSFDRDYGEFLPFGGGVLGRVSLVTRDFNHRRTAGGELDNVVLVRRVTQVVVLKSPTSTTGMETEWQIH